VPPAFTKGFDSLTILLNNDWVGTVRKIYFYNQMNLNSGNVTSDKRIESQAEAIINVCIHHIDVVDMDLSQQLSSVYINFYEWCDEAVSSDIKNTVKILLIQQPAYYKYRDRVCDFIDQFFDENVSFISKISLQKWLLPTLLSIPRLVEGVYISTLTEQY
jgi:hypothetical protein